MLLRDFHIMTIQIHISRRALIMALMGFLLLLAVPSASAQESDLAQIGCPEAAWGLDPAMTAPAYWADWDVWAAYYIAVYALAPALEKPAVFTAFNKCYLFKGAGFTDVQARILLLVFAEIHELNSVRARLDALEEQYRQHTAWYNSYHHSH